MNKSLSIFLISDSVRMIEVAYETDEKGQPKDGKVYKFKTFDDNIKPNDLVVVPTSTRVGFTVVKVIRTDVQEELDFTYDDRVDYKWVAGTFEKSFYDEGVTKEATLLTAVAAAEKAKKKAELREALLGNLPEDQKANLLGNVSAPINPVPTIAPAPVPTYNPSPSIKGDDIPF